MWYFLPSFVNIAPLTFSLVYLPPFLCQSTVYTDSVCGWEGVGVLSPVGNHVLQKFNTLYLTRFRTYKIARPSQTITWEGTDR
jgi:hypothetical protein